MLIGLITCRMINVRICSNAIVWVGLLAKNVSVLIQKLSENYWKEIEMKIAILEPHSDDAFLCLGGFILTHRKHELKIITISGSEHNKENETKKLEELFDNVTTQNFNIRDIIRGKKGEHSFYKEFGIERKNLSLKAIFRVMNNVDFEGMNRYLNKKLKSFDAVILPLGLDHPMHKLVSKLKFKNPTFYYKEFPYSGMPSNKEEFIGLISDKRKKTLLFGGNIRNNKTELFKRIYKSQWFLTTKNSLENIRNFDEEVFKEGIYSFDDCDRIKEVIEKIWEIWD